MSSSEIADQMRADWNRRAREDAHYYVAFGSRNQEEAAFLETGQGTVKELEAELKRLPVERLPKMRRALEIGCGPGRLLLPMSRNFGEIHGVDVSDEMVALARQRLQHVPHAHFHVGNGSSLPQFADESFDFIYSYAVFQHMPSRAAVLEYLAEACRLLRPGGVFRGQLNGLPQAGANEPYTWSGVRFSGDEIRAIARKHGVQLLALEGVLTQYMWTTWRKPEVSSANRNAAAVVERWSNAFTQGPVTPATGRFAIISLLCRNLPHSADLNSLEALVDGKPGVLRYLGPVDKSGLQQINVALPPGLRTGMLPLQLMHNHTPVAAPITLRVVPAGPAVPRLIAVMDGINVVFENRTISGIVKIQIEELAEPEQLAVSLGSVPVENLEYFLTDPLPSRYEVNFRVPSGVPAGIHNLHVSAGVRKLPPIQLTTC